MTGAPLKFEEVSGASAREQGFARADTDTRYIKVHLARPVPDGGGARIRILKTYKDPKSYFTEGDAVVFTRSLGIPRNSVVLLMVLFENVQVFNARSETRSALTHDPEPHALIACSPKNRTQAKK